MIAECARLIYPCGELSLRPLSEQDIPAVAELYRSVHISRRNCLERLSFDNERSFQNIGGMFIIQNEESLVKIANNPHEVATVAKDKAGNVSAFLWNNLTPPEPSYLDLIEYIDGCKYLDAGVRESYRAGKLAWDGEVIVANGRYRHIALPLFYTQLGLIQDRNIDVMLGEVYRVVRYRIGEVETKTDLLNKRSMETLARTGAVYVGQAAEKTIPLNGFQVTVRPQMFFWDIQAARVNVRKRFLIEDFIYREVSR